MTAINPTLSDLLPGPLEHLGEELKKELRKNGPAIGLPFVEKQLAEGLRGALKTVDLCEQLAKGWVVYKDIKQFRDQPENETAVVQLGRHELSFEATPTLKVSVGESPAVVLKFTYEVTVEFDKATLSIRAGALVAAAFGECKVGAVLRCGEQVIHRRDLLHLPMPPDHTFDPPCKIPAG